MATGRVGGTKAKIRGQVGNEVFQIRNNGDGTYTQIVMEKGVRTETETSPKLQAQRMCMCMVEAFMRDIRPVGQISMQSMKTKTDSLNALSSWNVQKVATDCREHWYRDNDFLYPTRQMKGQPDEELGGLYMLSSGTLDEDLFDTITYDDLPAAVFLDQFNVHDGFVYLGFQGIRLNITVGDFLRARHMTRLDSIVLVAFREWFDWHGGEEDSVHYTRHSYMIAQVNPDMKDTDVLTQESIKNLFVFQTDFNALTALSRDGKMIGVGMKLSQYEDDETVYFIGGFSISYAMGKKRVKSATMFDPQNLGSQYLLHNAPAEVFYSWMGEPMHKPYPSPFD